MPPWLIPAGMAAFSLGKSLFGKKKNKGSRNINVGNEISNLYNTTGGFWDPLMKDYGARAGGHLDFANSTFPGLWDQAGESSARGGFSDIAGSGGWDPSTLSTVRGGYSSLLSPLSGDVTSRLRGKGVFDENLATGGYKQSDLDLALEESRSSIPSFYSGIKRDINRRRRVSGGYGPGFDESLREAARESSQGAAQATRRGRLDIADMVRGGRMEMGSRMSGAEQGLQGLMLSRSSTGLSGLAGVEQNLAGNKLSALGGLADIDQRSFQNRAGLYGTQLDAGMHMLDKQLQTAGISQEQRMRLLQMAQQNPGWFEKYGSSIINALVSAGSAWLGREKGPTTIDKPVG